MLKCLLLEGPKTHLTYKYSKEIIISSVFSESIGSVPKTINVMRRLLSCWIGVCMACCLYSQDVPKVTNKVFIENITLTQKPGEAPMLGNILIENGIITAVGKSAQAPYDAKVIKGDSLHAYAGFIAPLSHIGLEKPKESRERPRVDRTGYPPNDVAGITPEKELQDLYKKDEKSIASFRKEGFTISHTCLLYTSPSPRD